MSRKILHNKLQIWETQAHRNESFPQKFSMFIHFWFYFLIFLFGWGDLKFWISIFCQTNFIIWWKHVLFFENWIQQKCFQFCCMYYQVYLIQPWRYNINIHNIRYMKYNISPRFNKLTWLCISRNPSIADWFN